MELQESSINKNISSISKVQTAAGWTEIPLMQQFRFKIVEFSSIACSGTLLRKSNMYGNISIQSQRKENNLSVFMNHM